MVKDRTYSALESRAKAQQPTAGRAYGYRNGGVIESEAAVVREIFERFADGASTRDVAKVLNARGVPSPGSSWDRVTRRASGWMGSGIRVIIRNERYRGVVHWNTSEWRKDCDSGKRTRHLRPRSEWITHADESLRIVSDDLWSRAQERMRGQQLAPVRSGFRPKYLLSGLLRCDVCHAHYIGVNGREYGCSSHRDGGGCSNAVRVRRDHVQHVIVDPVKDDLLAPARIERMAAEMQIYYAIRPRHCRRERLSSRVSFRNLAPESSACGSG